MSSKVVWNGVGHKVRIGTRGANVLHTTPRVALCEDQFVVGHVDPVVGFPTHLFKAGHLVKAQLAV